MTDIEVDYGIEYKVHKVNDNTYLLFPNRLVQGYCSTKVFYTVDKEMRTLTEKADLESGETVVDEIFSQEELCTIYDMDDVEFVKEYFLGEEQDRVLVVRTENDKLVRSKVLMETFFANNPSVEYEKQQGQGAVTLNGYALDNLLNMVDIETIRVELKKYRNMMGSSSGSKGVNVASKNGDQDADMKVFPGGAPMYQNEANVSTDERGKQVGTSGVADVSLRGLETHMKERVFGHDEEIRRIAKTIMMNYTAIPGEKNEAILLIGPTGTGKTETMKAAIDYLNIPLLEINSANLVPQGIKGMSIEDCLYSLIVEAGYDLEKAEKGLVFFDEFDKLGESNSDSKAAVVQILLKFIEGDTFMIDKPTDDYKFKTHMLTKIFAGAFSNLFVTKKSIGFGDKAVGATPEFDPRIVTETQYFGKELVTRIPHIFVYHELSREIKRDVLLRSKLSEFLLKKQRYQRQFNVELSADDGYVEAILEKLESHEKSMRDLNNLIVKSLDEAEYEMLCNPTAYKKLVLTRECVEDPKKAKLM